MPCHLTNVGLPGSLRIDPITGTVESSVAELLLPSHIVIHGNSTKAADEALDHA